MDAPEMNRTLYIDESGNPVDVLDNPRVERTRAFLSSVL